MFGTFSLISTRPLESTIKVDPSTPYAACVASGTILDVMVGAMYSDASLKAVTKIWGSQGGDCCSSPEATERAKEVHRSCPSRRRLTRFADHSLTATTASAMASVRT